MAPTAELKWKILMRVTSQASGAEKRREWGEEEAPGGVPQEQTILRGQLPKGIHH
jgi:hypothetical protein